MKKILALLAGAVLCLGGMSLGGCSKSKVETGKAAPAQGRALIATEQAMPQDLTNSYTTPVAYFDKITQFPAWKTVPRGQQFFAGVPLDIEGMMCLWGERNANKLHIEFPEQILGIAMNRKFEALYVYHGAFFTAPTGTPVCSVVFRYEDGSSATNFMKYGEDILDWVANQDGKPVVGPSAARSRLAWVGGSFSPTKKRPLRLCLTAIENPQPDVLVKSVDLYSCKSTVAACIMAMTAGKEGLLR